MPRTRLLAALPLAALLTVACDNAGEHSETNNETEAATGANPVSRQDSATVGQQIQSAPPPVGTTGTTPPDSNPSPTTPGGPPPAGQGTGGAN